jgi:hypothetical protein
MTAFLVAGLFTFGAITVVEAYLLLGRAQLLLNRVDQLLDAARRLLASVPGKSAAPTTAEDDARPRSWYQRLRELARGDVDDLVEQLDRLDADYDAAPRPGPVPPTVPTFAAITAAHRQEFPARVDDVDVALSRFTYAAGHHRAS